MNMSIKLPLIEPRELPCMPCPHRAACCTWGVDISPDEVKALVAKFGDSVIDRNPRQSAGGGWMRTAVRDGHCVFWVAPDGGCSIHAEAMYPAVCRAFPFADVDGGAYQGDVSDCPEMG